MVQQGLSPNYGILSSNICIMALKIGQFAPDFSLPSTSGKEFSLSRDLKDTACILYFYPRDFTGGCTAEACAFRDSMEVFKNLDIAVLGISRDDLDTHLRFKKANDLPFDLLSDTAGKVSKAYGALVPILYFPRRITYLLDSDHRIKAVHKNLFNAEKHIKS